MISIDALQNLIFQSRELSHAGIHSFDFEDGKKTFYCGSNALEAFIEKNNIMKIYSTVPIDYRAVKEGIILSIGSTREHNMARLDSFKSGIQYATCPLPFSNDSFVTDRWGGSIDKPASIMNFPTAVILDWKICLNEGLEKNLPGVGEASGLVTSIYDYLKVHKIENITLYWEEAKTYVNRLLYLWQSNGCDESRIIDLGAVLSFKGLLMRRCADNSIGASCDHMISYFLQASGFQLPHGVLVFIGMLISLMAIDEELCDFYLRIGRNIGLIHESDIILLLKLDFHNLFQESARLRPLRKTFIRDISTEESYKIGERFKRRIRSYV
ncbi:MAG: iron-containing alcohol dehydrogenase [Candidatus Aminicenantes bacterium]|nr:MAG: iron-containing alcohol dehydrogenase [Candidatus Aminicenantes bacterium]